MQFSQRTQKRFSVLGYYQIAGGVLGIGMVGWLSSTVDNFTPLIAAIVAPAFLLFFFSIYCGWLLVKRKEKGINLSLINQFLQLIFFAAGGYGLQYVSGCYFSLGFYLNPSFNVNFGAGISSWKVNINTGDPAFLFDFNFMALIIIYLLVNLKSLIRKEGFFRFIDEPQSRPRL